MGDMNMLDEAKVNGALRDLETLTDEHKKSAEYTQFLRKEMRRQAVNAHLDYGVSLATVCRATGVARNTLYDWVAAEIRARKSGQD